MKLFLVIFSVIGSVLSQSYGGMRLNPQRGAELITNRFATQGTQGSVQGLQTIVQRFQNNGQVVQNPGQIQENSGQVVQNPGQIQQGFQNTGPGLPNIGQRVQNSEQGQSNEQLSGQVLQNTRTASGVQDYDDFYEEEFQNRGYSGGGSSGSYGK